MDNIARFDTQEMRTIANAISADTNELRTQTDPQIGKIDDTCKALPSVVYNMAAPGFLVVKAFLGRSMDIRDRISSILKQAADVVEEQEKQIESLFQ
jgi:conjugal transfer/entry exclusion protein